MEERGKNILVLPYTAVKPTRKEREMEERIDHVSVLLFVEHKEQELAEEDFDPRKKCPAFAYNWFGAEKSVWKDYDLFRIEGVLSTEQLHTWLQQMPMQMMKIPTEDFQGVMWIRFEKRTPNSLIEMFVHPFLASGNTNWEEKQVAMLQEFGK